MNPGNEPPEIPSFKPPTGQGDEKKGGGIVPSSAKPAPSSGFKFPGFGGGSTGASKAFSAPNLKVRGLGGGGATVMDRLKNLRKKDLIFIGAGLCTLGMAPLAEHLLMSPDEQSAKLQEGFNSQQGPLFQDGSSVYEPGNGVGSPGGLVGQGQDVITPLNVRDPSNLIMSPGAQKKADAVASAPPPPPSAPAKESDWKDVLRDSAKSGAGKAAAAAPRPRPNVGKMAGAIRGLSALGGGGGGTGASLKLDPLSARGVPNTAAGSNALTRSQAAPGFRGATTRSGASSGAGEDLRAAGARQSDIFNRGGGAGAALDAASREAIPTGGAGSGGGRPGEGGETKNPGGNSHKDNKSLGESLAFLRQKMEMEKSLDLKWERKKWNEFGRQKMMEESALKLGFDMFGKFAEKAFIGPLGDMVGQAVAGQEGTRGFQCTAGDFKFITKAKFAAMKCNILGGSIKCVEPAFSATGCSEVTLHGSAPADPTGGATTDRPPVNTPGAGGDRMGEQQRQMGQLTDMVAGEKRNASSMAREIKAACSGLSPQAPAALRTNCPVLAQQAENLSGALQTLETASGDLRTAWGHLQGAANNMGKERDNLVPAANSLGAAATKLVEAETALKMQEGATEPPSDAASKAKVTAARTDAEAAAAKFTAAKADIQATNKLVVDSEAKGANAKVLGERALTAIQAVTPPPAVTDTGGTTANYGDYLTRLNGAKERAQTAWRNFDSSQQLWRTGQDAAVTARDGLHGNAQNATEMKVDLSGQNPKVPDGKGAMGVAYNNFGEHLAPLTAKTNNPYETAYTAAKAAYTSFQCPSAEGCAPLKAQAYNSKLTESLTGQGGAGTLPAVNNENHRLASGAVRAAGELVGTMANAVKAAPAGTAGTQTAAAPPAAPPAATE